VLNFVKVEVDSPGHRFARPPSLRQAVKKGLQLLQRLKKYIFGAAMVNPNSKSYYAAAIIIGLSVGLATRDMPVGILLAVVLMVLFSALRKKDSQ
jgi:hypothetical protein